jgi:hypothetical protein
MTFKAPDFYHAHLATIKIQRLNKIGNANSGMEIFHIDESPIRRSVVRL